jgi:hypothetical protein
MKSLHSVLAVVALCFLCLVWGAVAALTGWFPGGLLEDAVTGAQAAWRLHQYDRQRHISFLWQQARRPNGGVTVHDAARAFAGYTLYTSGDVQGASLVAMDGETVHEWQLPYDQIWEPSSPVEPRPAHHIYWRKARVFPNGDLMALIIGVGSTPWGHGLVRMDADSRLVWKFLEPTHHDFAIGDDGRIYVLTHRFMQERIAAHPNIQLPCLEDFVAVLSPDGEKLDEVSLFEAMANSDFAHVLDRARQSPEGEYMHANAVEVMDAQDAARFPFGGEGQMLVCLPQLDMLMTVDLDARRATWGATGPWRFPHDPDLLENGHLLIFDNHGDASDRGHSRVLEVDPHTLGIVWSYGGSRGRPLESRMRSAQERLPNGNTLVTESDGARIVEVTHDGRIVWEFINPVRGGWGEELVPVVSWASRMPAEFFESAFRSRLAARTKTPEGRAEPEP